jgi:hypothetical protein
MISKLKNGHLNNGKVLRRVISWVEKQELTLKNSEILALKLLLFQTIGISTQLSRRFMKHVVNQFRKERASTGVLVKLLLSLL